MLRKDKLAAEAHCKHPEMLDQVSSLVLCSLVTLCQMCRFYDLVARWFTVTADPKQEQLWPDVPRTEVAAVPQWLLDDLFHFYQWLTHHAIDVFGALLSLSSSLCVTAGQETLGTIRICFLFSLFCCPERSTFATPTCEDRWWT